MENSFKEGKELLEIGNLVKDKLKDVIERYIVFYLKCIWLGFIWICC